jgi:ABC-type polysaccharide/polyol phosphate export permease
MRSSLVLSALDIDSASFFARAKKIIFFDLLPNLVVVCCAILMSAQMRISISWGKQLGFDYRPLTPSIWAILIVCSLAVSGLGIYFRRLLRIPNTKRQRFFAALFLLFVCAALMLSIDEKLSGIQVFYFVAAGFVIAFLLIVAPPATYIFGREVTMFYHLRQMWDHRYLIRIMVQYNILSRYSQTILGILWIILIPLSTSLILTFLFSVLLRAIDIGDAPYLAFFLSGLTFYMFSNQGILLSTGLFRSTMGVISQVYFPREILILVKMGEVLVDLTYMFTSMLLVNAVVGVLPNPHYIYLPLLILIQTGITVGAMFFISYLSVQIRDIPQLVNIIMQLMFYVLPIIYPLNVLPQEYRFLVFINPLAALIENYREIILYNRPPDPPSLYYSIASAIVLLYVGYKFFKRNEQNLADYV